MNELTEHEMESEQDVGKELKLSICTPSKRFIEQRALRVIDDVQNGIINPIELAVKIKAIQQMGDLILEGCKSMVLDELGKQKGHTTMLGAVVKQKEVNTKYSYESTPAWVALKEKEDAIAKERKSLEEMLKKIPKKMTEVDEDTGALTEYVPATKTSTTSFEVTLSKT